MVRISPSLIQSAYKQSKYLPFLLKSCKTIESAKQELQWIQLELPQNKWLWAVSQRARLVPLQYILGSQPFDQLSIKCSRRVLIPRWETEEWCVKLSKVLGRDSSLRVFDVCTGTGCIPLLLGDNHPNLRVKAMDIDKDAYELSKENQKLNNVTNVEFTLGDVFNYDGIGEMDLITSNPPYIKSSDLSIQKSVKLYEPKLALFGWLEFYKALIEKIVIPTNAKGFIFELGYVEQFEYTRDLLNELQKDQWEYKLYYDGANNPRCIIGWKKNDILECLERIK